MKELKNEAIYLVTPDNDNEQINIDELNKAVQEITDVVKQNDATDVALEIADEELVPEGSENGDASEELVVDGEPEEAVIVGEIPVEETEELVIADPEAETQDATQTIMSAAEEVNDNPTSDIEAELIPDGVEVGQQLANGPMYDLAKYLITAYHTTASLHRNLKGGAWFADHVQLDEYASEFLKMVDDIIEQNIALGGVEPEAREALNDYVVCDIRERDKNESYRIVREILQTIVTLIDSAKENGVPADVVSKLEEYQNWCRKEADYKIARTILGESKLMTRAEMKAEKLLEGKLSQVKQDALKDAIETGDDMYIYQDGDEVYYTDESPKKNPSLFQRVKLLGTFITDMENGKMTATYKAEKFDKKEYVSTSKFRKRINEEKIDGTEIPDTMDYVGEENNPKLEEIPTDKITLDQFKKDHKEEIDNSYKMTYGEEIDKDLYNALADYMYTDSITGNVQTKKDYIDPVDEVEKNKDLVNDSKNK